MAENTVKYTVNGRRHEAEAGASLLGELRANGYEVPSLCYHEALEPHYGACRLCLVEIKKGKFLITFYPQGTTSGGSILLEPLGPNKSESVFTISIDPITGKPKVRHDEK